jgi:chromosome segregation ATPase
MNKEENGMNPGLPEGAAAPEEIPTEKTSPLENTDRVEEVEIESTEAGADLEKLFDDYKEKRLEGVDIEAEAAKHMPDLQGAAAGIGLVPEELERLKRESGIESQLAENLEKIETLSRETREKIEAARVEEAVESA